MIAAISGNPLVGIGLALGGFLALFGVMLLVTRLTSAEPETTRKIFHAGSGALTLAFPFLFHETWPVFLLTGASGLLMIATKFVPAARDRFGAVANRVERSTFGEIYFPISVALLFWLTRESAPLLFIVPILMLSFADATCALVGARYGQTRYVGASKSVEGSVAFAAVAFLCVHVPLLLWTEIGRAESLIIAATLALLVMLLEGSAWRGLDNLFIPVGGYFLLRAYLPLDTAALLPRLGVTITLVALVVLARRRTTLEDDSLVAGAFLCYVAWAVMGWSWLIGPLAIVVGYRWLSPATPDNSRRMHAVPVVLSVWAPAIGWLALARASGEGAMLFPYTVVFGAHLAMFGTSRLAVQYPDIPLGTLFWRAVIMSWTIVIVPYLAVTGTAPSNLLSAAGAIGAITVGAAVFVRVEPAIREAPQTARRWLYQSVAATVASAGAWAIVIAVSRWRLP